MPNSVAIDLGWLHDYEAGSSLLEDLCQVRHLSLGKRQLLFADVLEKARHNSFGKALLFLELLVVHDELAVDATAIERMGRKMPVNLSFIKECVPGKDVYLRTLHRVWDIKKKLATLSKEPGPAKDLFDQMTNPGPGVFWSSEEKRYHDTFNFDDVEVEDEMTSLQDSNDTLGRVLFYMEFGRVIGHALMLSDSKRKWMDIIGEHVQRSMHQRVVDRIGKQVMNEFWTDHLLQAPPVAQLILRKAVLEGMRPLDAALDIRESENATKYRRVLAELSAAEQSGNLADRLNSQKTIEELDRISKLWRKHSDPEAGLSYVPRTFKFSSLVPDWIEWLGEPAPQVIKALAEISGLDKIRIKDKILTRPPGYIAFVSSWYTN